MTSDSVLKAIDENGNVYHLVCDTAGHQLIRLVDASGNPILTQAFQMDDTDKPAVSAYGKGTNPGDTPLLVDANGHIQADILTVPTTKVIPATGEVFKGFKAIVEEMYSNTNLGAGTQTVNGTAVPSGEIWKITRFAYYVNSGSINKVQIYVSGLATAMILLTDNAPTMNDWVPDQSEIYMQEDDYMVIKVWGATAGDDAYLEYAGHSFSAP